VGANRRVSVNRDALDGSVRGQFQLDPIGGATLIAALDAQSRKASAADERSYPQRLADALVTLAEQALDRGDLPQVAAQRPHVILLTTAETLQGSSGASTARLDGVGPVSEATAQLISCDADITPVTVERNGAVLDVGRTRREPTRAQRAAIIARDQTCIGCGAPAARCQIHHIRWWHRDHGPTNETNLCLTCWDCHHKVHHDGWDIIRDRDGRFAMYPPDPLTNQNRRRRS
jgi:NAD-dependent dihydropyrimidine dehydrogenase PreA subunit